MKKEINEKINFPLDWKYGIEISKIKEDIKALEELGATYINIYNEVECGCSFIKIEAYKINN